jgi:hypothetical protein
MDCKDLNSVKEMLSICVLISLLIITLYICGLVFFPPPFFFETIIYSFFLLNDVFFYEI